MARIARSSGNVNARIPERATGRRRSTPEACDGNDVFILWAVVS